MQRSQENEELFRYINLKLAALGESTSAATADAHFLNLAGPLLRNYYQKELLLGGRLCPVDERIQNFLDSYLDHCAPRLPSRTFVLDRPGLARAMSLPADADSFSSRWLNSYRVPQGILHNPKSDRRTTKGPGVQSGRGSTAVTHPGGVCRRRLPDPAATLPSTSLPTSFALEP